MGSELITEQHEYSSGENLSPPLTMAAFLADIEKKAYHMAAFATGSHADALDLLQDSMIKQVTKYQEKPANEWKPLFYKILQNRIRDWHRHHRIDRDGHRHRSGRHRRRDDRSRSSSSSS